MSPTDRPQVNRERILVLAPIGRDAETTARLLARSNLTAEICLDIADLALKLEQGAGAALIAEEALSGADTGVLELAIQRQPAWSDFPLIVFGNRLPERGSSKAAAFVAKQLGNVTLLDRPTHVRTMLIATQTALRARRRQYEAQREIESRDQFLAMLGHELRNPLAAMLVATEIMQRDSAPRTQQSQRGVIERHVRHLARLVDDLLDVARVAAGKITLERSAIELNGLIATSVESCEANARMQDLELSVELSREPIYVAGDRVRLEQIFGNLLTNAVKYTPRGGSIRVELEAKEGRAVASVTDSGIGIDPDMIERVFDLFAQADRSLERARGGMGIGLTLVQSLVRLHGGSVRAESAGLAKGSRFVVTLPLEAAPALDAAPDDEQLADVASRALEIVVVEDNSDLREGLVDVLELAGYRVVSAADGPEGVRRIVDERPNAALIDIGLPGIDGYEVARQVREALGAEVRLIALTGYGQPEDRRRALDSGFDAHLTKPVQVRDLERALDASAADETTRRKNRAGGVRASLIDVD